MTKDVSTSEALCMVIRHVKYLYFSMSVMLLSELLLSECGDRLHL